jgi:hypothetical protein
LFPTAATAGFRPGRSLRLHQGNLATVDTTTGISGPPQNVLVTRRWRHGQQAERWSAAALLAAEFRLRRLPGSRHLPALQAALEHHARQGGGLAVGA